MSGKVEIPMLNRNSALEVVGSVVVTSGRPVAGSRRKSERLSGNVGSTGALAVVSKTNEKVVPSVSAWEYSLKNVVVSSSVTVPGNAPETVPVVDDEPSVPSVAKLESVAVFPRRWAPDKIKCNVRADAC